MRRSSAAGSSHLNTGGMQGAAYSNMLLLDGGGTSRLGQEDKAGQLSGWRRLSGLVLCRKTVD